MFIVLTFAGSDPSGGAGIQADLRTFHSLGVYGLSVLSALTVQNTQGIDRIQEVSEDLMELQMKHLLEDTPIDAVKSGMLFSLGAVLVLSRQLRPLSGIPYVLDPVIWASDGTLLLQREALKVMVNDLFPLATVITPNLNEAGQLAGFPVTHDVPMREAARVIHAMGPRYVLIKGGHLDGDAVDLLYDGSTYEEFRSPRINDRKIHGAGCCFSAAITAGLSQGLEVVEAVRQAKSFITQVIQHSHPLGRGSHVLSAPPTLYK